ncbi:hypothetical protein [Nautilia sp.]
MRLKKLFKPTIRVEKTRFFYLSIAGMFILFAAGYVHNNNLAFIALFFLFSLSAVSVVLGRVNIGVAEIKVPEIRIFANQRVKIPFKKINFIGEAEDEFVFSKRGVNETEVLLKSNYPLKLAVFYKKVPFKVLVYPELKGRGIEDVFLNSRAEEEFKGLKRYNFEEPKYIHWPSLAKGDLQSKVFGGETHIRKFVFDYAKTPGTKEEKISQIALWAYEAFQKGYVFSIVLPDMTIDSKEGFDEVFKKLALYRPA